MAHYMQLLLFSDRFSTSFFHCFVSFELLVIDSCEAIILTNPSSLLSCNVTHPTGVPAKRCPVRAMKTKLSWWKKTIITNQGGKLGLINIHFQKQERRQQQQTVRGSLQTLILRLVMKPGPACARLPHYLCDIGAARLLECYSGHHLDAAAATAKAQWLSPPHHGITYPHSCNTSLKLGGGWMAGNLDWLPLQSLWVDDLKRLPVKMPMLTSRCLGVQVTQTLGFVGPLNHWLIG